MLRSPRSRSVSVFTCVAGLLLTLAAPSGAQVDTSGTDVPAPVEVEAVVIGTTQPPEDPHNLGVNRVQGSSKFEGIQIEATVVCTTANSVHTGSLVQPGQAGVEFTSDDDITDGFGEISSANFQGADQVGGGTITATIEDGRFHRLLGLVEVDLHLNVRVEGPGGAEICHARIPFRLILHLLPQHSPPGGDGFTVVGVGRRHHTVQIRVLGRLVHVGIETRIAASRIACDLVSEHSTTRVTEPPIVTTTSTPIGPGRGPFHPCPPEGDYERIEDYVTVESD